MVTLTPPHSPANSCVCAVQSLPSAGIVIPTTLPAASSTNTYSPPTPPSSTSPPPAPSTCPTCGQVSLVSAAMTCMNSCPPPKPRRSSSTSPPHPPPAAKAALSAASSACVIAIAASYEDSGSGKDGGGGGGSTAVNAPAAPFKTSLDPAAVLLPLPRRQRAHDDAWRCWD